MAKIANIQVLRGTIAQLGTYGALEAGELFFSTDTNEVWAGNGTSNVLAGRVMLGTTLPGAGVAGRMFLNTNTSESFIDNGSTWVAAGVSDLDAITDGDNYGKVKVTELQGGKNGDGTVKQINDGTNVVSAAQARGHIDSTLNPHSVTASQVGIDDLGDIADGGGFQKVADTEVDGSGRVTQVADGTNTVTASDARTHLDSTSNPHSTSIANIGTGTVSQLNTALSDATLGAGLNDSGSTSTDLWSASKVQAQIDSSSTSTDWKQEALAASVGNLTLSGTQTVDGVVLVAGNRILVKDQTIASANGIYVVDSAAWARSSDADTSTELSGAAIYIISGTVNEGAAYVQSAINPVVGTDDIIWRQFNGASSITAGAGLEKDGNILNVLMGAGLAQLPTGQVGVEVATDGGLSAGTAAGDTLTIVADSTTGATVAPIATSSNGAGITVDNDTIVHSTGTLAVGADSIGSTEIDETDSYTLSGTVALTGTATATTQSTGDNSPNLATTAYADAAAAGSAVTEGNGIDITGSVVSADVAVAGAVTSDFGSAGTLGVNVDGITIEIATNAIQVKADSIGATQIDETDNYTLSGTVALIGTATAVTQTALDGGTNLATTLYADDAASAAVTAGTNTAGDGIDITTLEVSVVADDSTGVAVAPVSVLAAGVGVGINTDTLEHSGGVLNVIAIDGGTL